MDIQQISPKKLKPYVLNAKLHPPEQIAKIIRSINLSGFDQPIVVNEEDGQLVVVKGHGRLLAALEMGLKEVPVVVLHLPKLVADQARLIDNKSQESGYDLEILLKELNKFGADELLDTGYDSQELERLLQNLEQSTEKIFDNEGNTKEIDVEDFELEHKCPKCGFEF